MKFNNIFQTFLLSWIPPQSSRYLGLQIKKERRCSIRIRRKEAYCCKDAVYG